MERRLTAHREGKGAKYTRGRGPLELVYREELADKSAALKRDWAVKQLSRAEKIKLIAHGGQPIEGRPLCLCFPYILPDQAALPTKAAKLASTRK